jgi:hypothetical protein
MCQAELRAAAAPRGERLFAERAEDLAERVTLYWASATSLAALAPADGRMPEVARKRRPRGPDGPHKGAASSSDQVPHARYRRR